MSVWSNWQDDLLGHAGLPTTAANERFLTDWHNDAETNCKNNPIDLSAPAGTGSDCHSLPGLIPKAQSYPTTGDAVHAFDVQIHKSDYKDLLAALKTGNPYTAHNTGLVSEDLSRWGSVSFSRRYFNATANAPGRSGGYNPTSPKAWGDLQHQVNRGLPTMLRHVVRINAATSTQLSRRRKVRR